MGGDADVESNSFRQIYQPQKLILLSKQEVTFLSLNEYGVNVTP